MDRSVDVMDSIWSKTVNKPRRQEEPLPTEAEIVVIGAGMAGLLTAYYLQRQGRQVIVLEALEIGSGQTKNTTAKITSQHGRIYHRLTEEFGEEQARLYVQANEQAIDAYEELIDREQFACHFKRTDACLYSAVSGKELEQEVFAARSIGIPAQYREQTNLPFLVQGAVCVPNQAEFHPLEFLQQLAGELHVYEHTNVLRVRGHRVITDHGKIVAEHIVFATHYPFPIIPGFYFARQHQERSYVLALAGVPKWEGMYYGVDEDGLSFRWYEDILLVGGGGHRTGEQIEELPADMPVVKHMPGRCGYSKLREQVKLLFPEATEVASWSAQDCMTHDGLPFIGKYSCLRPYWYVATGFGKWGMTGSMLAAQIISDRICGIPNPYAKLFSPQRLHVMAGWKEFKHDIKISVKGLIHGHSRKATVKCPHMGCELEWNPEEKTWDCPCHGSRFDGDGKLIDNPAQTGIGEK